MTRIGVIGDIHGNLPALRGVLRHAGDCEGWYCTGDIVGYGPYPVECCRELRKLGAISVAGNHDLGSLGRADLDDFNPEARAACEWTGRLLDPDTRSFLESLELRHQAEPDIHIVHGSPRDPVWEYLTSAGAALKNFSSFDERVCFVGHTHVPMVFILGPQRRVSLLIPGESGELEIENGNRYIINAGSVGQPRDHDARSCYVQYEPEKGLLSYHRVDYPISEVQQAMHEAGLPLFLAHRLVLGI